MSSNLKRSIEKNTQHKQNKSNKNIEVKDDKQAQSSNKIINAPIKSNVNENFQYFKNNQLKEDIKQKFNESFHRYKKDDINNSKLNIDDLIKNSDRKKDFDEAYKNSSSNFYRFKKENSDFNNREKIMSASMTSDDFHRYKKDPDTIIPRSPIKEMEELDSQHHRYRYVPINSQVNFNDDKIQINKIKLQQFVNIRSEIEKIFTQPATQNAYRSKKILFRTIFTESYHNNTLPIRLQTNNSIQLRLLPFSPNDQSKFLVTGLKGLREREYPLEHLAFKMSEALILMENSRELILTDLKQIALALRDCFSKDDQSFRDTMKGIQILGLLSDVLGHNLDDKQLLVFLRQLNKSIDHVKVGVFVNQVLNRVNSNAAIKKDCQNLIKKHIPKYKYLDISD